MQLRAYAGRSLARRPGSGLNGLRGDQGACRARAGTCGWAGWSACRCCSGRCRAVMVARPIEEVRGTACFASRAVSLPRRWCAAVGAPVEPGARAARRAALGDRLPASGSRLPIPPPGAARSARRGRGAARSHVRATPARRASPRSTRSTRRNPPIDALAHPLDGIVDAGFGRIVARRTASGGLRLHVGLHIMDCRAARTHNPWIVLRSARW